MLDSLRHLLLIAEHGSFREAARHAHLSQPALTASIQRLEEQMGASLLLRHARGARLSAAGEALRPHARATLAAVESGRQAVAEIQGLARGRVRIGGGATACTYLLPPLLTAFHQDFPGVDLRLRESFTPAVRQAVAQGELDLGLADAGGAPLPGLVEEAWMTDPLVLVAAPSLAPHLPHDGARLGPGAPAVTFSPGSALREILDAALPDLDVIIELGSIAAVKGHTRAGLGVALLSRVSVATDLELGRLVEVPDARLPPFRSIVLVHPGLDRLPPAAMALRERLLSSRLP